MPQEVSRAEIELEVSILESGGSDGNSPFPTLFLTDRKELRTFEGLVLENEWLYVTIFPDLGGRIWNLIDKRSGVDAFGGQLDFQERGPRGIHAFGGLELTLDGNPRLNALGHVRTQADDDGVLIAEAVVGGGLSYDIRISLNDATLQYGLTVRNRTLLPVSWNPGILWPSTGAASLIGGAMVSLDTTGIARFAAIPEGARFAEPAAGRFTCFDRPQQLAPRWGETIGLTIIPLGDAGTPVAISPFASLTISDTALALDVRFPVTGGKLVLQTAKGQTMEAPADLLPGEPLRYSFAELGGAPTGFALLDSDRSELLRYPPAEASQESAKHQFSYPDSLPEELDKLDLAPATRYWAAHLRTRQAFRAGDYSGAEQAAEQALLYNGEDSLGWIEKAIAARLAGDGPDEAPELPNAHFLAPLEPLLRSEAFLAQAGLDGKSFFASLADSPNDLVEVACTYVELGLYEDAARFIDAALSVSNLAMLRYLYAYCCIATGKLLTDAAAAVASVTSFDPPYPWRPVEKQALSTLVESFPNAEVLARYFSCCKK